MLTFYSFLPRLKNNTMRRAILGRAEQQTQLSVRRATNKGSNFVMRLRDSCWNYFQVRLAIIPHNSNCKGFVFFPVLEYLCSLVCFSMVTVSSFIQTKGTTRFVLEKDVKKGENTLRFCCCDHPESRMSEQDIVGWREGEVLPGAPLVPSHTI